MALARNWLHFHFVISHSRHVVNSLFKVSFLSSTFQCIRKKRFFIRLDKVGRENGMASEWESGYWSRVKVHTRNPVPCLISFCRTQDHHRSLSLLSQCVCWGTWVLMTSFCSWVVFFTFFLFFTISAWWWENVKRTSQVEKETKEESSKWHLFFHSPLGFSAFFSFLSLFSHQKSLKENKWERRENRKMTSKIIQLGWRRNTSYPMHSFVLSQLDSVLCFLLSFLAFLVGDDENHFLMMFLFFCSPFHSQQQDKTLRQSVSFLLCEWVWSWNKGRRMKTIIRVDRKERKFVSKLVEKKEVRSKGRPRYSNMCYRCCVRGCSVLSWCDVNELTCCTRDDMSFLPPILVTCLHLSASFLFFPLPPFLVSDVLQGERWNWGHTTP